MNNVATTIEIPNSVMWLAEALVKRGGLSGSDFTRLVTRAKWAGKKQGLSSQEVNDAAIARVESRT